MRVKEVMTRGVECVPPDATVQQAAEKMKALDVGSLPVCDDGRLVGMLTDRDIAVRSTAAGYDPANDRVRFAMTPGVVSCYEDQPVGEAALLMQQNQVRRLVVLSRDGGLAGIVSLGDVALQGRDERLAGTTVQAVSEPTPAGG